MRRVWVWDWVWVRVRVGVRVRVRVGVRVRLSRDIPRYIHAYIGTYICMNVDTYIFRLLRIFFLRAVGV